MGFLEGVSICLRYLVLNIKHQKSPSTFTITYLANKILYTEYSVKAVSNGMAKTLAEFWKSEHVHHAEMRVRLLIYEITHNVQ